jgi:hypothetical protein
MYIVRQNPHENTCQSDMRKFILSKELLTCPYGHIGTAREKVMDRVFNSDISLSQDRKFIQDLRVGDLVLVPFAGSKERTCILARILSDPFCEFNTGYIYRMEDGKIRVVPFYEGDIREGDIAFCPVVRKIQILRTNVVFADKRVLPRTSFSHVNHRTILAACAL